MKEKAPRRSASVRGPRTIGRYHVQGRIGFGGMGTVYKAEDRSIGRQVAVKTLTELTPELLERFYVEARSGIISHPNIVTVYELGEHGGCPFIAMEFIDGESLEQLLARRGNLPVPEAIAMVQQLCAGLGYAHGHGIVHRDIKPANVLVRPDGRVTIVDFGIARLADRTHALTRADTLLGTFHYIAPERLEGETGDGRADVWAAGVILYELVTGQLPFPGSPAAAVCQILQGSYRPATEHVPDLPEELSRVLARALDKTVETRYATAEEMAFDLRALAEGSKHNRAGELLATAGKLLEEGDLLNARAVLLEAQRINPNEPGTKALLHEVQQQLSFVRHNEKLGPSATPARKPAAKRRRQAAPQVEPASGPDPQNEPRASGKPEPGQRRRPRAAQKQKEPGVTAVPPRAAVDTTVPDTNKQALTRAFQPGEYARERRGNNAVQPPSAEKPIILLSDQAAGAAPDEALPSPSEVASPVRTSAMQVEDRRFNSTNRVITPFLAGAGESVSASDYKADSNRRYFQFASLTPPGKSKPRWLTIAAALALCAPLPAANILYAHRAAASKHPEGVSASADRKGFQMAAATNKHGQGALPKHKSIPSSTDVSKANKYRVPIAPTPAQPPERKRQ